MKEKPDLWLELLFNVIAAVSALLTIYGFLVQAQWRIAAIILGIVGLYFYTRWWIKDFIARDILLQNEKVNKIEGDYTKLKEEVTYMKGWMGAINHFNWKKGGGAIDPLTLIIAVIIIILVIAYLQGRLS
ncbi:hypothetical protein HYU17_01530 [Candidatus Woesearchaeota archaeon]|nr:hypothetical protein [Candidatus Woesearchaeota archaeon]